jgi:hypothetical protein
MTTDTDTAATWQFATTDTTNLERVYQTAQAAYIARFGCFPPTLTPLRTRRSGKALILVYPLPVIDPPTEPAQLSLMEV